MSQAPWHPAFDQHPHAGTLPSGPNVMSRTTTLPDPYSELIWQIEIKEKCIEQIRYQIQGSPIAMATCHWCAAYFLKHPTPPYPTLEILLQQCTKDFALADVDVHHAQWVLRAFYDLLTQIT